jgi:transcriptional regulator with XRE-family HTH domain
MPKHGSRPDKERRFQVAKLREQGLTLREIAKRLRVSYQSVHQLLQRTGNMRVVAISCRKCRTVITQMRGVADRNGPVWCLACLNKRPKATLGERLKAHRLAAGLTITELGRRSGVGWMSISYYECGRAEPKWRSLAKLISVLGTEWLA